MTMFKSPVPMTVPGLAEERAPGSHPPASRPIEPRKVARMGAQHLSKLVQPDGLFIYRYLPGPVLRVSPKYNVLRHCGAVWSMFDVVRLTGALPVVSHAAIRAGTYILDTFV